MRQTLLILSLSVVAGASAQVSFNGGTYSQDFNSLATSGTVAWNDNSTLQGWYLRRMDDANGELGDEYRGGDGTSNAGAAYGFGTGTDSERALGSVASGSVEHLAYGVRLTNDTGADITEFTLSYMGEQWRNGGNATPQTLLFSYNIGGASIGNDQQVSGGEAGYVADSSFTQVSSLDFLSPIANATASALDGNAAANRSLISGTVSNINWGAGQDLWIRWVDINNAGNDHGLAIDDLTFEAAAVPEPATMAVLGLGVAALVRRRNRRA